MEMQTEYASLSFTFSPPEVPVIYREEHNAPWREKHSVYTRY